MRTGRGANPFDLSHRAREPRRRPDGEPDALEPWSYQETLTQLRAVASDGCLLLRVPPQPAAHGHSNGPWNAAKALFQAGLVPQLFPHGLERIRVDQS